MSLSDKIENLPWLGNSIKVKYIKEVVKELKEDLWVNGTDIRHYELIPIKEVIEKIDKIFGDALVNKSERGLKNGKNN